MASLNRPHSSRKKHRHARLKMTMLTVFSPGRNKVLESSAEGGIHLFGTGIADWHCGACDAVQVQGVAAEDFPALLLTPENAPVVLHCRHCGAFNIAVPMGPLLRCRLG